jgi:hypothetical protein
MSILSEEIEAFHKRIRARALLMAIEWAGSASELGRRAGGTRYAGGTWVKRGCIPAVSAKRLAKLPGFPVTAFELVLPVDYSVVGRRKICPHCWRSIKPHGRQTGSSPSFNRLTNRQRKKPASKRPAQPASTPARKRQSAA